jgi:large conductance mechanosensitive channel
MSRGLEFLRGKPAGLLSEFRQFAVKGNVVDMAVGIIIGAAFGKIVSSLVADVVMPPIGFLIGGVDFSHLVLELKHSTGALPPVAIKYGQFLQTVLDFVIVAAAVFALVKMIQKLKRQEAVAPSAPPAPSKEEELLTEIRDLLAEQRRR